MEYQPLKYIYRNGGGSDSPTLLLLHGTGGNERDLLSLADEFGVGINVLSVRGNVLEHGLPRFFKRLGMGIFDEADLEFRTGELVAFVKNAAVELGFSIDKVIALGYSNGANIAAGVLSLFPDFFSGAILYRPMQPFKDVSRQHTTSRNTPVFLSNGVMDPTIETVQTENYVQSLRNAAFEVRDFSLHTGHNLSQQDLQLSVDWFEENFGSQRSGSK